MDRSFRRIGLPPEVHLVAALDYLEPGDAGDPEVLERLRAGATAVSVAEGETKTIDLRLSR